MSDDPTADEDEDQPPVFLAMGKGEDLDDFVNRVRAAAGLGPQESD